MKLVKTKPDDFFVNDIPEKSDHDNIENDEITILKKQVKSLRKQILSYQQLSENSLEEISRDSRKNFDQSKRHVEFNDRTYTAYNINGDYFLLDNGMLRELSSIHYNVDKFPLKALHLIRKECGLDNIPEIVEITYADDDECPREHKFSITGDGEKCYFYCKCGTIIELENFHKQSTFLSGYCYKCPDCSMKYDEQLIDRLKKELNIISESIEEKTERDTEDF